METWIKRDKKKFISSSSSNLYRSITSTSVKNIDLNVQKLKLQLLKHLAWTLFNWKKQLHNEFYWIVCSSRRAYCFFLGAFGMRREFECEQSYSFKVLKSLWDTVRWWWILLNTLFWSISSNFPETRNRKKRNNCLKMNIAYESIGCFHKTIRFDVYLCPDRVVAVNRWQFSNERKLN